MIVHDDLFVIFTSMGEENDQKKELGVPKGPLLVWVYGAWYKKRNVTTTIVKEKYSKLFGLELVSKDNFVRLIKKTKQLKDNAKTLADYGIKGPGPGKLTCPIRLMNVSAQIYLSAHLFFFLNIFS